MKQRKALFFRAVVFVVLMAMAGCGSSDSGSKKDFPEGATVLSNEEYDSLLNKGALIEISDNDQEDQSEEIENQYKQDTETIEAFIRETGADDPRPPEPKADEDTVILPDGNVRHTIIFNDGSKRDVINLGRKQSTHSIAKGIKVFPTRENQVDIYRYLYESIATLDESVSMREGPLLDQLGLQDPDTIDNNPNEYTVDVVESMNNSVLDHLDTLLGAIGEAPQVVFEPYDCGNDMGAGEGSDRNGCESTCGFLDTGIFKNYTWNHKDDLTCVKDQANRGTCCAFAVVSATEYWVNRRLGYRVNLSEQALYNRMKLNWVRDDLYDGYYISDALDYCIAELYLIPFEEQWNYNPSPWRDELDGGGFNQSCTNYTETCSDTSHQSDIVCNGSGNCSFHVPEKNPGHYGYRLKNGHVLWDHTDPETSFWRILIYLAFGDPVLIQVPVLDQFDDAHKFFGGYVHYIAGDVDDLSTPNVNESTNRGNHIMHAVSIITNTKLKSILPNAPEGAGGGYVIVKNSWSNCWGDGGYVYLPYEYIRKYTQYSSVLTKIYEE